METQQQLSEYKVVGGTAYHLNTPDRLVALLEDIRRDSIRVRIVYGNTTTGVSWEEHFPERGRIGRSTGTYKVPLLVKTSRSLGGGMLLTDCILQLYTSPGGRLLYQHGIPTL